jgi:hypothetical protein
MKNTSHSFWKPIASNSATILSVALLGLAQAGAAQAQVASVGRPALPPLPRPSAGKQVFEVKQPDLKLSPQTGMTRKHWQEAGQYLLTGAFSYVHTLDDALQFPKQPGKSYPRTPSQVPTEKLEGLCRTLFIAAPLLKENPGLELNHIKLAEYYRHQLIKLIDPKSDTYITPRAPNGGPHQNLVEFGGLSVALFAAPEILWDPLTKAQKDQLAATMLSYGDGPTVPQNWKFFNIFILSFFKSRGYTVNEKLLEEYVQKALGHYRGEGWYDDNPAFDYYSMWAFQMYGVLWSEYFGKQHYPAYAQQFAANFQPLKDNYPYMFGRNGEMIMWGRSISYRFGATIPFPLMGLAQVPNANLGWMRRIASGTLLQFLQNPDLLQDQVPTLGFYGPFEPAVQSYSCRGSAFWMGKAFLGLLVPANNPYWTATENEGPWAKEFAKNQVYNKFEKGSTLLLTDYPNSGAAELRAWCHVPIIGAGEPFRGSENYNRLAYNSAFPWQADGPNGEVAMNYVFQNKEKQWEALRLFDFQRFTDGVYYRKATLETNPNIKISLSDMPLANGILRIDKNTSTEAVAARLGHYALPGTIKRETRRVSGHEVQLISNGQYQLAMVPLLGWQGVETVASKGLNPVSDESAVLNVAATFAANERKQPIYATLMLWKKAGELWTNDELVPVQKLTYSAQANSVEVAFRNGTKKTVTFTE